METGNEFPGVYSRAIQSLHRDVNWTIEPDNLPVLRASALRIAFRLDQRFCHSPSCQIRYHPRGCHSLARLVMIATLPKHDRWTIEICMHLFRTLSRQQNTKSCVKYQVDQFSDKGSYKQRNQRIGRVFLESLSRHQKTTSFLSVSA
jgi:hypothetical protein